MIRRHLFLSALAFLIALFAVYLVGPWTAITVKTGTLDAATPQIGDTRYENVREVTVKLLPRPYTVTVTQKDYEPYRRLIWIAPWRPAVINLAPKLTAEGKERHEVREAATRIVATLGTYDARDGFDLYLEKLKALTTPELYQDLSENPAYLKGRASDIAVGAKAATTVSRAELSSLTSERATLTADAVTKITTAKEGRVSVRKKYTLTLKSQDGGWKLAALHEEYAK